MSSVPGFVQQWHPEEIITAFRADKTTQQGITVAFLVGATGLLLPTFVTGDEIEC